MSPSSATPHPLNVLEGILRGVAHLIIATVEVAKEAYTHRLVEAGWQEESPPPPTFSTPIPQEAMKVGQALGNIFFGLHALQIWAGTEFADSAAARWIVEARANADARGESLEAYLKRQCFQYGCHLAVRGMHEDRDFGAVEVLAKKALELDIRKDELFCLGSALVESRWLTATDPVRALRNAVLRARHHPTDDPRSHEYGMRPPRIRSLGTRAQFVSLDAGNSKPNVTEASDELHPSDMIGTLTHHGLPRDEQLEQVRAAVKKKLTPQAYALWEEHQRGWSYAEAARRLHMSDRERERYRREITRKTKPIRQRLGISEP